jgi:hypothetical protein
MRISFPRLSRMGLLLLLAAGCRPVRADDILFIGNSFTSGAAAPVVQKYGGVPALFEEMARAQGRPVETFALTASGKDWSYHLSQPATGRALRAKKWAWVVLQDLSTRPTHIGDVKKFLQDGNAFSKKIAAESPTAGILLFETWARPPGPFYQVAPGNGFSGPNQMMDELHRAYARLRDDLAAQKQTRATKVAPIGTAFARAAAEFPALQLHASDHHHATAEGYYLAALVIDETLYGESVKGAPTIFFHGELTIPAGDAAKLQQVADEVATAG